MTAREPSCRVFFALWPDEAMRDALLGAALPATRSIDGRVLPRDNIHLTLAFLGSVPERRLVDLQRIAARVAAGFRPRGGALTVTLDRLEHWRKAQILCAAASRLPAGMAALSEELKGALVAESFTPDLKPFRAHVTLARKVRRLTGELQMAPVLWTFHDFRLIESRTGNDGSVYSVRERWMLYEP